MQKNSVGWLQFDKNKRYNRKEILFKPEELNSKNKRLGQILRLLIRLWIQ